MENENSENENSNPPVTTGTPAPVAEPTPIVPIPTAIPTSKKPDTTLPQGEPTLTRPTGAAFPNKPDTGPPVKSRSPEKTRNLILISITIFAFICFGIALYFASKYFAAKSFVEESQATPTPTATSEPSPDETTEPTMVPLPDGETPQPTATSDPTVVPDDWKEHTGTDENKGLTITLSAPSNCSFNFNGSEFVMECGANETWAYVSSVLINSDENPLNTYDGGSIRAWYQKFLNGELESIDNLIKSGDILSSTEHTIGTTSYLEMKVDNRFSGSIENHFLYVQNGIVHIFKPMSQGANSSSAVLVKNIGGIFYSLTSRSGG